MPHVTDALPSPPSTIHIMGIAGTAMGSLAAMLKDAGYTVTGSDKAVYPPMSEVLASLGIEVMEGFEAHNLDHEPDLVVVGNVVRAVFPEAERLLASDLPYVSMPQLLGELYLQDAHPLVVAGTHGKTTTTALCAWLLESAGLEPGFFIGGVAPNFDRTARAGGGHLFVIEGDEYDTAFFDKRPKLVHYRPKTAILTSVEFDHADIYPNIEAIERSFATFIDLLPSDGHLVVRGDDPRAARLAQAAACPVTTYGPGQEWDGRVDQVDTDRGRVSFTVLRRGDPVGTFTSTLVGEHNLYNQVAAVAACTHLGASVDALQQGFSSFRGIRRRQEVIGEPGGVTVVDDFAHHPTSVRLTLEGLRERFGGRRLWAIWEPRSATSRRNHFQQAYAQAFDAADQVVIAAPFDDGRLKAQERFSAEALVHDLTARGLDAITLPHAEHIAATVAMRAHPHDVVAILSNGGFGGLHGRLLELLEARFQEAVS